MNQGVAGNNLRKLRILVAPLDWGLGHATRCIPIIRTLEALGCEPVLAGEGAQARLLGQEFPHLPLLELRGYRIRYAATGSGLAWSLLRQSPKILRSIDQEHAWLKRMVADHGIHGVISDNRFGLHHDRVPSVFITHQLRIKTPLGRLAEHLVQRWNYHYIERFGECWVPDVEQEDGLAGELSHPSKMPAIAVRYLGPLSRFNKTGEGEEERHLLVLLSGPEPQRSIFEQIILSQLPAYTGTVTLVRGLPGKNETLPSTGRVTCYNHLPAEALAKEMERASLVLSRSGYSTIMDLVAIGKKSILVPTPGQTEQEYLAEHLEKKGMAPSMNQRKFVLSEALKAAGAFDYRGLKTMPIDQELVEVIRGWIFN